MKRLDTLLLLCKCLNIGHDGRERVDTLRQRLEGGDARWELLIELANQHLLCPALFGALKCKDLLASIPAEPRHYLQTLYEGNRQRNRRLLALVQETVRHLNDAGVEPVLLKGTANLYSGLYPDPGMRFLCDIDILIPPDKTTDCVNRLHAADYHFQSNAGLENREKSRHDPPLMKRNESIGVELHRELIHERYRRLLDAENVFRDALPLAAEGMRARIPSVHHRIIHNIAHTQIHHDNYTRRTLSLRQLYDFVLMADAFDGRMDWESATLQFKRSGCLNALSEYLLAGSLFFGRPLSAGMQSTAGGRAALMRFCAQENHLWAMRLGNLRRIVIHYRNRIRLLLENRSMPQIWNRDFQLRHSRLLISELRRRW
jgi:hypothetical protein